MKPEALMAEASSPILLILATFPYTEVTAGRLLKRNCGENAESVYRTMREEEVYQNTPEVA